MSDDFLSQRGPAPRSSGRWAVMLLMALTGFAVGGGAVGWLVLHGELPAALHNAAGLSGWHHGESAPPTAAPSAPAAPIALATSESALETRLATTEQRLDRLDMQAAAAAGNAARAEGLLVAFAARRVIERGAQLGYLEDQLKLRFGDAQPRAVSTLIATARTPVTLDLLTAKLEMMAPRLAQAPKSESLWERTRRELGDMLTIHRDTISGPTPAARLDHAMACLREGGIETAIADVQRLPDSAETESWIAEAHRYAEAERALDLIETTALLEPRTLGDGAGHRVNQPSPLTPPALAAPGAGH